MALISHRGGSDGHKFIWCYFSNIVAKSNKCCWNSATNVVFSNILFLKISKKSARDFAKMLLKTTFVAEFQQHLLFLATMLLKYHHINLCPSDPPLHDMRAIYPKKLRFLEPGTRFQALARAWHAPVTNFRKLHILMLHHAKFQICTNFPSCPNLIGQKIDRFEQN